MVFSSAAIRRAFSMVATGAGTPMRAVRVSKFGGPDVLTLESNVPIPTPGESEVLVKVMSAGVNPVDTYIREGTYARVPDLPYIPGSDCAGIIESTGTGIRGIKVGDRVFCSRKCSSAYAEYCTAPSNSVFPLAARLSFAQGAAIGVPYFTAYRALVQKCAAKPAQTVLVHGASGAVGLAAVQIARAYGLTVYGTAGSADGLKVVKENGAHAVFNHKEPGYTGKIMEATENGVDIILEMLSNVNLGKDLPMLKRFGKVAVVGCRGSVEINPRQLMAKESYIIGVAMASASEEDWSEMAAAIGAGMDQGWVTPVVDREYPLERVGQAHMDILNSPSGARGKLVLSIASQC